jgi:sugar phosphate isomerase/epimerase
MKVMRVETVLFGMLLAATLLCSIPAVAAGPGAPAAEAIGWRLGCQLWSFNRFTFMEAIDKTASMGLKYAEAFPGQRLSPDLPEDVKFEHGMSEEHRLLGQKKLQEAGVKVVAYGVVGLSKNEEENRKVFEFAKAMGIETLSSEPPKSALELVGKLADEYGINVAIHNHPKPSLYWDYSILAEAVAGSSTRIGSCADTGHWARSGLNPLDAVKALEGRIISFHLKDLNVIGDRTAHDVIWGTGVLDVKSILAEVYRQKIVNPIFSIEYEHNWENNVPDITECVAYFDKVAAEISGK